jgi:hypothetical protein
MSWEDAYMTMNDKLEAERIQKRMERKLNTMSMEEQFHFLYPTLSLDKLHIQPTGGYWGITYYVDIKTKKKYNWNDTTHRWSCDPK